MQLLSFQCLRHRLFPELLPLLHCHQPETVLVGKVVAGTSGTTAFDERSGPEVLKAGARGDQRLASTLRPSSSVLKDRRVGCELCLPGPSMEGLSVLLLWGGAYVPHSIALDSGIT